MTIDLRERMVELVASQEVLFRGARAPQGWEERYIINPSETPWWEILDSKEREKTQKRQLLRMWDKVHPGYYAERSRKYARRHPEYYTEANRKHCSTHVYTPSTFGKASFLFVPYKREQPDSCELCGSRPHRKGWHHWDDKNPSMGLWICLQCNCFAGAVDAGGWELVEKYVIYKELLDEQYADGEVVRKAMLAGQHCYMELIVDGVRRLFSAPGKRNRPRGNLCELCSISECLAYHHWDNDILGKGLWVCNKCHCLTERFDTYGKTFVKKYLFLKRQDELRVSCLMEASSEEAEQHD